MPVITHETVSGSVYAVAGSWVRKLNGSGGGVVDDWTEVRSVTRIPASVRHPGSEGSILEVVLEDGKRMYTSPLR